MLENKKILVTGLLNHRSIAYGVAKAMYREAVEPAFTFQGEGVRERAEKLASEFDAKVNLPCDVASGEEIAGLFGKLAQSWDGLDGIVHAIAYAPREALAGDFHAAVTRENVRITLDISACRLAALVKGGLPLMQGRNAAVVAVTYLGAVRAVPNYNVMVLPRQALKHATAIWHSVSGRWASV